MSIHQYLLKGLKQNIRTKLKYSAAIIGIWVFTTEIMVYSIWPIFWPNIKGDPNKDGLRILVSADPQLLGYQNTLPGVLGRIVRSDADRFIRKTHSMAHKHFKPDFSVFLGDIFDEGESATDLEFDGYFERFTDIFYTSNLTSAVFVPGDNDIGGEQSYPINSFVRRFDNYFRPDGYIQYKYLEIFKVNVMTMRRMYKTAFPRSKNIRLLLSHIPLMPTMLPLAKKSMEELLPHLILSGHEHTSNYFCVDPVLIELKLYQQAFTENFKVIKLNISDGFVHEIMVPTCSYRMGTEKMGYGALLIEPDGTIHYTVYWLPSRLKQLFSYIILGILVFFILNTSLIDFLPKLIATKGGVPSRTRV